MKVINRNNTIYKMAATVENVHSNMLVRIMSRNVSHACDFGICFYKEKIKIYSSINDLKNKNLDI
jgi:hypothetical protein